MTRQARLYGLVHGTRKALGSGSEKVLEKGNMSGLTQDKTGEGPCEGNGFGSNSGRGHCVSDTDKILRITGKGVQW